VVASLRSAAISLIEVIIEVTNSMRAVAFMLLVVISNFYKEAPIALVVAEEVSILEAIFFYSISIKERKSGVKTGFFEG